MLVEELFYNIVRYFRFVILYGVRYFNYDLYVFQFEQTFRQFRAPATEPGPGAAYPSDPPLIDPGFRLHRRI